MWGGGWSWAGGGAALLTLYQRHAAKGCGCVRLGSSIARWKNHEKSRKLIIPGTVLTHRNSKFYFPPLAQYPVEENKSVRFFVCLVNSCPWSHQGSRQVSRQHCSKKVMESIEGFGRRHEHDYRTDTDTQTDVMIAESIMNRHGSSLSIIIHHDRS